MVNKEKVTTTTCGFPGLQQARRKVAAALLEQTGSSAGKHQRFTLKTMASNAGAEWGTIRLSLASLQDEGAIRLERHRIYVNRDALRKLAHARISA